MRRSPCAVDGKLLSQNGLKKSQNRRWKRKGGGGGAVLTRIPKLYAHDCCVFWQLWSTCVKNVGCGQIAPQKSRDFLPWCWLSCIACLLRPSSPCFRRLRKWCKEDSASGLCGCNTAVWRNLTSFSFFSRKLENGTALCFSQLRFRRLQNGLRYPLFRFFS